MNRPIVVGAIATISQLAGTASTISEALSISGSTFAAESSEILYLAGDLELFARSLILFSQLLEDSKPPYSDSLLLHIARIIRDCTEFCDRIEKDFVKSGKTEQSSWTLLVKFRDGQIPELMMSLKEMKGALETMSHNLKFDPQLSLLNISSSNKVQAPIERSLHPDPIKSLHEAYLMADVLAISAEHLRHAVKTQPVQAESTQSERLGATTNAYSNLGQAENPEPVLGTSNNQSIVVPPISPKQVPPVGCEKDIIRKLALDIAGPRIADKAIPSRVLRPCSSSESFKTAIFVPEKNVDKSDKVTAVEFSSTDFINFDVENRNPLQNFDFDSFLRQSEEPFTFDCGIHSEDMWTNLSQEMDCWNGPDGSDQFCDLRDTVSASLSTVPYPPCETNIYQHPSVTAQPLSFGAHDRVVDQSPLTSRCSICGEKFRDLKAHQLTHTETYPEKCPFVSCKYHTRGFRRKFDADKHTLTHYKGVITCGICVFDGRTFSRVDVFKRHMISAHDATAVGYCGKLDLSDKTPGGENGRIPCSICTVKFSNVRDFYGHIDSCAMRAVRELALMDVEDLKRNQARHPELSEQERERQKEPLQSQAAGSDHIRHPSDSLRTIDNAIKPGHIPESFGNHALHDYQMQLMLLEQLNKEKRMKTLFVERDGPTTMKSECATLSFDDCVNQCAFSWQPQPPLMDQHEKIADTALVQVKTPENYDTGHAAMPAEYLSYQQRYLKDLEASNIARLRLLERQKEPLHPAEPTINLRTPEAHNRLQDYQLQLMSLEAQNKKRLYESRRESASKDVGSTQIDTDALYASSLPFRVTKRRTTPDEEETIHGIITERQTNMGNTGVESTQSVPCPEYQTQIKAESHPFNGPTETRPESTSHAFLRSEENSKALREYQMSLMTLTCGNPNRKKMYRISEMNPDSRSQIQSNSFRQTQNDTPLEESGNGSIDIEYECSIETQIRNRQANDDASIPEKIAAVKHTNADYTFSHVPNTRKATDDEETTIEHKSLSPKRSLLEPEDGQATEYPMPDLRQAHETCFTDVSKNQPQDTAFHVAENANPSDVLDFMGSAESQDDADQDDLNASNDMAEDSPLLVNSKQFHRILKRRVARQELVHYLEAQPKRKPTAWKGHVARRRPRGPDGRLLTADELAVRDNERLEHEEKFTSVEKMALPKEMQNTDAPQQALGCPEQDTSVPDACNGDQNDADSDGQLFGVQVLDDGSESDGSWEFVAGVGLD